MHSSGESEEHQWPSKMLKLRLGRGAASIESEVLVIAAHIQRASMHGNTVGTRVRPPAFPFQGLRPWASSRPTLARYRIDYHIERKLNTKY